MKSKVRARWAHLFVQPDIPRATQALATESSLHCWKKLILSAWELDEMMRSSTTRERTTAREDEDEDEDEDDETYVDVEYWQDDVEEADLDLMEIGWKWNDKDE
jgi:ribulose 1,5-bisphosphate carboxylase large subunit-like protein